MILYLSNDNYESVLKQTIEAILSYKLVILPTDTVYGFSGHYMSFHIRQRIVEIKGRSLDKGFIILIPDQKSLLSLSRQKVPDLLLKRLLNPLTLIIETYPNKYYGNTLAVRIPNEEWLCRILKELDFYLISTSVNISGEKPLKSPKEIINAFQNKVDLIIIRQEDLYNNTIHSKMPSTILDIHLKPYKILRQGEYYLSERFLNELRNEPI